VKALEEKLKSLVCKPKSTLSVSSVSSPGVSVRSMVRCIPSARSVSRPKRLPSPSKVEFVCRDLNIRFLQPKQWTERYRWLGLGRSAHVHAVKMVHPDFYQSFVALKCYDMDGPYSSRWSDVDRLTMQANLEKMHQPGVVQNDVRGANFGKRSRGQSKIPRW